MVVVFLFCSEGNKQACWLLIFLCHFYVTAKLRDNLYSMQFVARGSLRGSVTILRLPAALLGRQTIFTLRILFIYLMQWSCANVNFTHGRTEPRVAQTALVSSFCGQMASFDLCTEVEVALCGAQSTRFAPRSFSEQSKAPS